MAELFDIIIVIAVILIAVSVQSKKKGRDKGTVKRSSSSAQSIQSAVTNAVVHGHDHVGDARSEKVIHAALDGAKQTGLINLNGKLYTREQLRGL